MQLKTRNELAYKTTANRETCYLKFLKSVIYFPDTFITVLGQIKFYSLKSAKNIWKID